MGDSLLTRSRLLPFLPYVLVGTAHLAALFVHAEPGSTWTKLLIMPALLLGLLLSLARTRDRPRLGELVLLGGLGILFSWAGDALLESPGDVGFLIGLGCFLLAHLAYLVLFLRPLRERRPPRIALLYLLWWLVLVLFLAPQIGPLLVPVAAYGLVLAASSGAALGSNRLAGAGALVFLCSDTILALKLFQPGFAFWQIDFAIMLLYILGQGLIAVAIAIPVRRFPTAPPR